MVNCHLTLGRIKGQAFGLGGWAEFPDSLHVPAAVLEKRTRSPEYDSRPLCRSLTIAGKNSLSLKGYPSTFVIDGKRGQSRSQGSVRATAAGRRPRRC